MNVMFGLPGTVSQTVLGLPMILSRRMLKRISRDRLS